MKGLLWDENLPEVTALPSALPVTKAVDLGARPTDTEIWNHAREHDLLIVTKDADFSQRIILTSPPPKVVHLRIGNMKRRDFMVWIERLWPRIEAIAKNHKLVTVTAGMIQGVQ